MSVDVRLPFQKLEVYEVARDLVRVVVRAQIKDRETRTQAENASKSAFLNLAEGLPSTNGPTRRTFFERARCSMCECVAAMDLAGVLGVASPALVQEAHVLGNRFDNLVRGLLRA